MALPVLPTDPNSAIPNSPFYYPLTNLLQSSTGPLIVGSGLSIDYATAIIDASGGGGGGVSAILAGTGINLTANTGIVTVSNTGVLSVVAGSGITVTNVGGVYTVTNISPGGPSTGTVTQVNTGAGLTGGPITASGTIALSPSGVAAATYTNPTITVDQYGRITFAAPGTPGGGGTVLATLPLVSNNLTPPTVSINPGSLTACGAIQLCDAVNSTSTTRAATPNAVKQAYDLATTATANAATALATATTASADAATALATAGTANTNALQALSDAAAAQSTANSALTTATTANTSATTALALSTTANTNATNAVTQASIRIPCSAFQVKGDILIGCGAAQFAPLAVAADGAILLTCAACPLGVKWGIGCLFTGTVTSVTAGVGLNGGTITGSGTISIANTGVAPGSYTYANFTVNPEGQLTAAGSGSPPILSIIGNSPISVVPGVTSSISIAAASTISPGAVQLYNATNGTSTALALTAAAGKFLQDQINALVLSPNQTLAGTLDASTGTVSTVTTEGTAAGFTVGLNLPIAAPLNSGYFVIVSDDGVYTPPGGVAQNCTKGDWFFSDGVSWQFLDVGGSVIPYASTTTEGLVCLSTFAAAQGGVDNTTALTPATGASALISRNCSAAKGTLIVGSGPASPVALPIDPVAGKLLTVDMACPTGVKWATNTAIPCSCILSKGSLIVGAAASVPFPFAASPTDGEVLTVCAACFTGLTWTPRCAGTVTSIAIGAGLSGGPTITTTGTIALAPSGVAAATYTNPTIIVDQYGRITSAAGGTSGIPCSFLTAKGALVTATAALTPVTLNLGTNGQVLTVDSTCARGMKWVAPTTGTVVSVTAGVGLTGGTITTSGTIDLAITGVIPGTYSNPTLLVDAAGRIVGASNNPNPLTALTGTAPIAVTTGTTPTISVGASSLAASGVVQLTNSLSSPSNTLALTASAGALLQSQIDALVVSSNITFAGTLDAAAGVLDYVTSSGLSAGFVQGSNLPAPGPANTDYFVTVTDPGIYTPPGGTPITTTRGDWFISDGVSWNFLNVGLDLPDSTTTTPGIIREATNADTQTGTDANSAVTPASLQSKISNAVNVSSSTTIASSTAVKLAYDTATAAIPRSCVTAKGSLVSGDGFAATSLPTGTSGQVLAVDPGATTGLAWINPCQGTLTSVNTGTGLTGGPISVSGTISLDNTSVVSGCYTYANICVDAQGRLTAASCGVEPITALNVGDGLFGNPTANITGTSPTTTICLPNVGPGNVTCNLVKEVSVDNKGRVTNLISYPSAPVLSGCFPSKGSVLAGSAPGLFTALPLGTTGQILTVSPATVSGLAWETPPADVPCSSFSAKGQILVGCATAGTFTALPPGTNGQILSACSTCTQGLYWATPTADVPLSAFATKGQLLVGGTTACTYAPLSVGTNNQVLTACSTCPNGLYWATPATTACWSRVGSTQIVLGSMPVGSYCCILFPSFGSGSTSTPIALTVDVSISRAGITLACGEVYIWQAGTVTSSVLGWGLVGSTGSNQTTSNISRSWIFTAPANSPTCYGVTVSVSRNDAPSDCMRVIATGTIQELR